MAEQLRLVYSRPNEMRPGPRYVKCETLPHASSRSPRVMSLQRKVALLVNLSPSAAQVIEQLVDDVMAEIRRRKLPDGFPPLE